MRRLLILVCIAGCVEPTAPCLDTAHAKIQNELAKGSVEAKIVVCIGPNTKPILP